MKRSEFYEKYWKIDFGNGKLVSPPKLSDAEKEFLDSCPDNSNAMFYRVRKRPVMVNVDFLNEEMKKLPPYFIPVNQPKLDKWGNVLEQSEAHKKNQQ